jgi:uncharacterized repeat protein (TIGR03943 family)
LYSRLANGTLYFYIAQRFVGFTLIAIVGLIVVGISYHIDHKNRHDGHSEEDPDRMSYEHAQDEHMHDLHTHDRHVYSQTLSWGGALLMLSPVLLGLITPARPLGSAALANREINISAKPSGLPTSVRTAAEKTPLEMNILDWSQRFHGVEDAARQFAGEQARVVGFVFRDERFTEDSFLVTRFVVRYCAADSSAVGLVVRWPQTAQLQADQWVEVQGRFAPASFEGKPTPVLHAENVVAVDVPNQPYLYP